VFFQHTRTSKKIADVRFAHQPTRRLASVRQQGIMQGLYPDGKAQVAIEYENNTPIAITNLVISTHHAPSLSLIERLNLLRPIYRATAAYGHFSRTEFPWEASDRVVELQRAMG
jgi:S-adenosylmethionine synthetase